MKAIERIFEYINLKKINKSELERKANISNGYLAKQLQRKADVGESILVNILQNCPEINPEWLLTGNGTMLKSEVPEQVAVLNNKDMIDKMCELSAENAILKKEIKELRNRNRTPDVPVGSRLPKEYQMQELSTLPLMAAEPQAVYNKTLKN